MESKKMESQEEQAASGTDAEESASAQELNEETKLALEIETKLKELNEKYTRLYAEYDNYRRRTAKEKVDMVKFAGEETILSFLPVVDDMERAIAHHKDAGDAKKSIKEGLELIYQKMVKILTAKGVTPMGEKGEAFDAELHEAITNLPVEDKNLKGKIVDVVEKGYTLNGKVIRHAKVVVGS